MNDAPGMNDTPATVPPAGGPRQPTSAGTKELSEQDGRFALSRSNMVLLGMLVLVVMLTAWSRIDYGRPNMEVLPDMKYTPAWTAYAANPNFANGRTLQAPVPGTIARGELPLHYSASKEDAVRAGLEIENPYHRPSQPPAAAPDSPSGADDESSASHQAPSDEPSPDDLAAAALRDSVRRGGDVYRIYCVSCHGATGAGDGPVPKRGFPPPPSLLAGNSRQMRDGQLFHILTYGQGSMSPFAAQLTRDQRWDAINYVRNMQQSAPLDAQPTGIEEPPTADSVPVGADTDTTIGENNDAP